MIYSLVINDIIKLQLQIITIYNINNEVINTMLLIQDNISIVQKIIVLYKIFIN